MGGFTGHQAWLWRGPQSVSPVALSPHPCPKPRRETARLLLTRRDRRHPFGNANAARSVGLLAQARPTQSQRDTRGARRSREALNGFDKRIATKTQSHKVGTKLFVFLCDLMPGG